MYQASNRQTFSRSSHPHIQYCMPRVQQQIQCMIPEKLLRYTLSPRMHVTYGSKCRRNMPSNRWLSSDPPAVIRGPVTPCFKIHRTVNTDPITGVGCYRNTRRMLFHNLVHCRKQCESRKMLTYIVSVINPSHGELSATSQEMRCAQ